MIRILINDHQGEFWLEDISVDDATSVVATNIFGSKIAYQMELAIGDRKGLLLAFESQVPAYRQTYP